MAGKVAVDASPKAALRRQIIAARDALPPEQRREFGAVITSQLFALDAYRNAGCVLAYMSFGSEFDTAALIAEALASGKQLCLPRVNRDTRRLELHVVENPERDLQSGTWGIREPRAGCPPADLARIDFVLLPGVAFTRRCERLGYGGGFYDRLIPRFASRPPLVAAAYSLQICDTVPLDANDRCIDVVITESATYRAGD